MHFGPSGDVVLYKEPPIDNEQPASPPEAIVWTVIPALTSGDRNIYVSRSGNDGNNGLTEGAPKATIAAGYAALRAGQADRLLLKKGDTWHEAALYTGFTKSGISVNRPLIIGSYGTGDVRPIIDALDHSGISTGGNSTSYVWVIGIEFTSVQYDGSLASINGLTKADYKNGIFCYNAHHWLIEDCYIHNFANGIVYEGSYGAAGPRATDIQLRATTIADIYISDLASAGVPLDHGEGFYSQATDGILIEWCNFDWCGWKDSVPNSIDDNANGGLARACYCDAMGANGATDACTGIVYRNNVSTNTDGAQIRPGGIITGNVSSRQATGLQVGSHQYTSPNGYQFVMTDNVILENGSLTDTQLTRAISIEDVGMNAVSQCSRNIVANAARTSSPSRGRCVGLRLTNQPNPTIRSGARLNMYYNIFYLSNGINMDRTASGSYVGDIAWYGNRFHMGTSDPTYSAKTGPLVDAAFSSTGSYDAVNAIARGGGTYNTFSAGSAQSTWMIAGSGAAFAYANAAAFFSAINDPHGSSTPYTYAHPDRNLAKYYLSIGGTEDHDAFTTILRTQRKDAWVKEWTAPYICRYIREGFV